MSDSGRAKVVVIGTGGTISYDGRDSLDVWQYADYGERNGIEAICARFPEITTYADIDPVEVVTLPSTAVGPAEWLQIAETIHSRAASDPPAGFLITHGTASLEETAYFLHLTLKTELPVVVIGAQRPLSGLSTDAAWNLVNGVQVAASSEARGLGVVTLLNEEIQSAREVTKTSTHRLETFRAPDLGMLGYADADGRVAIYRRPTRRHTQDAMFDARTIRDLPRVDVVPSYGGADAVAMDAYIAAGAKGIVMASFAPGMVTPTQRDAMARARDQGIAVVMSNRAGSGRVMRRDSMKTAGIVAGDNLNPQKARILLMLALTATDNPDAIQEIFDTH